MFTDMRPPGPEGAEAARLGHWSFQRMARTEPLALSDLKVYSVFKKKKSERSKKEKNITNLIDFS